MHIVPQDIVIPSADVFTITTGNTTTGNNPSTGLTPNTMSQFTPPRGAIDLPILGTKGAPHKFRGTAHRVESFLRHYEKLCDKYAVTSAKEKIENLTQYCSREVREFLEGLKSYTGNNWATFKKDIKEYYNTDREERRFRLRDLEKYCEHYRSQNHGYRDLSAWRTYSRGFIRIAGWLREKNKITDSEYNTYLWMGIPRAFRDRLENRLMSQNPTHDISTPFEAIKVEAVAKTLLQRDRFDRERMPSEDEYDSSESDLEEYDFKDSGSEDSSSETSDSDEERKHKKSRKKKHTSERLTKHKKLKLGKPKPSKHKKTVRFEEDEEEKYESDEEDATSHKEHPKTTADGETVEDLIQKLGRMSINDPTYAITYFRAYSLSPHVQQVVPSPLDTRRRPDSRNYSPWEERMQERTETRRRLRDVPPHMANTGPRRPARSFAGCFGCGDPNHSLGACPKILDLEKKKVIRMDERSKRWIMYDGTVIKRMSEEEPLVPAIARNMPAETNYVASSYRRSDEEEFQEAYPVVVEAIRTERYASDADDSYSDGEVTAAGRTFVMERTPRGIRAARREAMDGVRAPPLPQRLTARQNRAKEKDQGGQGKPNAPKGKGEDKPYTPQKQKPIEVEKPANFNPDDSDEVMRDDPPVQKAVPPKEQPKKQSGNTTDKENKEETRERHPRVSELQSRTNMQDVLAKVLKAPVTMEVGEILGVSKEMAHHVQEALKLRSSGGKSQATAKAAYYAEADGPLSDLEHPMVGAVFAPRPRGSLIRVSIDYGGRLIRAIVDTGSQLNIVSKRVCNDILSEPVNITKNIKMNDANGGVGILTGYLADVQLRCGGVVETRASIFIGEQVPFDLLLGRPWQRGNYVTIDERKEGTYLLFKDKELNTQYELLASRDRDLHDGIIEDYLARYGQDTYLITTEAQEHSASIEELDTEDQPWVTTEPNSPHGPPAEEIGEPVEDSPTDEALNMSKLLQQLEQIRAEECPRPEKVQETAGSNAQSNTKNAPSRSGSAPGRIQGWQGEPLPENAQNVWMRAPIPSYPIRASELEIKKQDETSSSYIVTVKDEREAAQTQEVFEVERPRQVNDLANYNSHLQRPPRRITEQAPPESRMEEELEALCQQLEELHIRDPPSRDERGTGVFTSVWNQDPEEGSWDPQFLHTHRRQRKAAIYKYQKKREQPLHPPWLSPPRHHRPPSRRGDTLGDHRRAILAIAEERTGPTRKYKVLYPMKLRANVRRRREKFTHECWTGHRCYMTGTLCSHACSEWADLEPMIKWIKKRKRAKTGQDTPKGTTNL